MPTICAVTTPIFHQKHAPYLHLSHATCVNHAPICALTTPPQVLEDQALIVMCSMNPSLKFYKLYFLLMRLELECQCVNVSLFIYVNNSIAQSIDMSIFLSFNLSISQQNNFLFNLTQHCFH